MATAGLSFGNPLAPSGGVPSPVVNPYELRNPANTSGLGGMGDGLADISMMGARAVQVFAGAGAAPTLARPSGPSIGYSPSQKKFAVQGITFDEDDASTALQSEQLLGGAPTGLPSGDWVPLSRQQYDQYLQSIRQPGLGTLASKSFGRGVDITQMLVGRGLQLAGAEELGGRIVERQIEDLRKTQPYERQFTDIESGRGAVEWFVANAAQQGPNIIESIVTAALGFMAGTASSGNPLGGAAASVAGLIGKESWKNSVKSALAKRAAGQTLDASEQAVLRTAAGLGMMTAATFSQNMATGAADIYGEFRERGADADDVSARIMALGGSVPYALLETLPEALLFGRLMGGGRPALSTLPTARAKAGEILRRGAVGGGVGGLAEGTTELGQEALVLRLTDQELGAPENVNRLINSFAAGFAIGGPIGAGVSVVNPGAPSNLLQRGAATDPTSASQPITPTLPANAPRGTQGELFPIAPGEMAGPAVSPLPPPPVPGVVPAQPGQMALFEPTAPTVASRMERGIMPPGPMAQGQLALTGGRVAPGYVPPQAFAPEVPAVPGLTPQEAAAQGALQFAPAAPQPQAPTAVGNALQQAIRRQQEQQMLAQRESQLAAQREADMQRLAVQAANQRQLDLAAQAAAAPTPTAPMVPVQPAQPQQLPLFTRRQAPIPPKAGQLRRGGRMRPVAPAETDRGIRQASLQLPLFTAEGEPSLPALRAAGVKTKVAPTPPKPPAAKTAGARGLKRGARVAEVTVKEAPSAVQKPSPAPVPAQPRAKAGPGVGAQVPAKKQAARKGEALKAKKPEAEVTPPAPTPVKPDRAQVQATLNTIEKGDTIVTDDGDRILVTEVTRNKNGDVTGIVTTRIDEAGFTFIDFHGLASFFTPQPYIDSTTGARKFSEPATIEKAKKPLKKEAPKAPKVEAAPAAAPAPAEVRTAIRKLRAAFGSRLQAQRQDNDRLRAFRNPALARAIIANDVAKALDILSRSKNAVIAWVGERAKGISGLSIRLDPDAAEYATGKLKQDLEIAKISLAILDRLRELAPTITDQTSLFPSALNAPVEIDGEQRMANPVFGEAQITKAKFDKLLAEYEGLLGGREEFVRAMIRYAEKPMAVGGSYNPDTKTVSVLGEYEARQEGILGHELVHALTVDAIKSPTAAQREPVRKLRALFEAVKDNPEISQTYGVTSLEEFVAEGLSNPEFQFQLSRIPYENTTAWGKFAQFIADILGLEADNAFMELIALSEQLTAPPAPTPSRAAAADLVAALTEPKPTPAPTAAPTPAPAPAVSTEAETQWNEARLTGDVAYADLPQAAKDRWESSDRSGAVLTVIVEDLKEDLNRIAAKGYAVTAARIKATRTEWLNYAQAAASAAMDDVDIDSFEVAIPLVVKVAYDPPDGFSKEQQAEALDFVFDPNNFNNAENAVIQDSFVLVFEGQTKEATTKKTKTGTGEEGANKPWYAYAQNVPGMIQRLGKASVVFRGLPDTEAKQLLQDGLISRANLPDSVANAILGKQVTKKDDSEANPQRSPLSYLLEEITKLNSSTAPLNAKGQKAAIERLQGYYNAALEQDLDTEQVDQYFRTDGTPITANVDGKFRVLNEEDYNNRGALEAASRSERKAADAAKRGPTISTFDDWEEDGRFFTDDNKPLRAMDVGRIRMAVAKFTGKLKIKPKVHVFRNQADLKARNPQLYARAAAARTDGDFDIVPASGYSFGGDQVIIFTDRIRTEAHLNFVLAHETLGHFGLRSIIPKAEFDAVMEDIYRLSPNVQLAVDAAMDTRGLSRSEAVEEYLADFAGSLDVSYIARIWNAIKSALNKLGVKFGDEAARYWVDQSRRYVRTGQVSSTFTVQDVMARMRAIETGQDPDNSGRFAIAGDLRMDNMRAADLMQDVSAGYKDIGEAVKSLKGVMGNTQEGVDKFLAQVFSLANFRARENAGAYEVDQTLREGRGIAMQVRNALNEKLAPLLNRAVEVPFSDIKFGGITEAQYEQANRLLYAAQRLKFSTIPSPKELGRTPLYTVNPDTGELVPNQPEIDRLYNMGLITVEQARDGFTYKDTFMRDGEEVTETVRVEGIPGLTKDSPEWKAYDVTREAMRDVELELLRARYLSFTQDRKFAFREIGEVTTNGKLTAAEKKFFEQAYKRYKELWTSDPLFDEKNRVTPNPESIDRANEFLAAFNTALIAEQKEASGDAVAVERNTKLRAFLEGPADDFIAALEGFKDRFVRSDETKFTVQNRMKDLIAADVSNDGADVATRRNLAGGYTPILRRGGFQLRINATVGGKAVRLKQDYKDQLVYSQFESRDEAVEFSKRINSTLFREDGQPKTYKVEAFNEDTMQYELMDVQLTAVPGTSLDGVAAPPELNLNEFVRGLRQFSIALPPKKLEQVVVALTAQNDRARQRLERNFVPGGSTDAGRAVAEHIEARASTIAKIIMRPRLAELTNLNLRSTRALWYGDENRLNTLKQNWEAVSADPGASPEKKLAAKREYDFYALQYDKTNPLVKGVRVERGAQYFNEAASALQFLEQNRNVDESNFASGKVASQVRAATSYMQLGGSIATGALNYIGALTNSLAYMATYNEKTAFGGGYGLGKSVSEFTRALNQVGLRKAVTGRVLAGQDLNTAEFYTRVVGSDELQKRYGLTKAEAEFLAFEIREGEMVPALSNATTNTARGRVSSGAWQKLLDGWMWTFNSTEQAVRRAVGLATYRMEFARAKAAEMSDTDADTLAREAAVNALRFTLGDYSVMNRPPMWRSGVLSFVYIYKTFPTMSIQLFKRLPREGQLYMLAALWMLGGLTAFPFAEDIEDLVDTIAQGLGFKQASVRYEIAKLVDSVAPGTSPYVLRGFANAYFPGNVADRVSLGNFIPGTGVLLAGANIGKELSDLAGPAVSMLLGTGQSFVDTIRAPLSERVNMIDVLRESPVTMFRALGDAIAYTQSGAIVDKRGYVVTPDLDAATIATRLLGFYPAAASEQYDVIRVSKRMTDYQKEVVAGFRVAWVKAKIQGDEAQAQQIVEAVNEWNTGARGTALEIRNFLPNAVRALREAQRPAGERFLRAAPRAAREDIETVADLLGY